MESVDESDPPLLSVELLLELSVLVELSSLLWDCPSPPSEDWLSVLPLSLVSPLDESSEELLLPLLSPELPLPLPLSSVEDEDEDDEEEEEDELEVSGPAEMPSWTVVPRAAVPLTDCHTTLPIETSLE